MRLLKLTPQCGKNFHSPDNIRPRSEREYVAALATALDAAQYPALARSWTGFLKINGRLAINDNPEARRKAAKFFVETA